MAGKEFTRLNIRVCGPYVVDIIIKEIGFDLGQNTKFKQFMSRYMKFIVQF